MNIKYKGGIAKRKNDIFNEFEEEEEIDDNTEVCSYYLETIFIDNLKKGIFLDSIFTQYKTIPIFSPEFIKSLCDLINISDNEKIIKILLFISNGPLENSSRLIKFNILEFYL